jgi:5-formyltetrahydrofolate cyclo-ligase
MSDFAREAERSRSAKVALRSHLLTARRSLPEAVRRSAEASVQASTLALVRRTQPTVCAAYVPVGTEPGGESLPAVLAELCTVLLPVLLPGGDLDWARYDGALRRSQRGLLEPSGVTLGTSAITQADLIIVPALAVSRAGMRLGRGGGSYDRALTRASAPTPASEPAPPPAFTVALLHDGEILDEVPHEPHDRPVNAVITPTAGLTTLPA